MHSVIYNMDFEEKPIKLYVAMYDGNRLLHIEPKSITVTESEVSALSLSSVQIPDGCTEIKAFVWSGDTLKPVYICNSDELPETGDKIMLAEFNNSEYEGISEPSASVVSLNTEITYCNAATSLEWNLDSNFINVSIAGKALDSYENGGTLYVKFKGTAGTRFNLVYQKMPDATAAIGNLRKLITADGTWQTYGVDFSDIAGFYDDETFSVKFDCGGWGLSADADYTVNDRVHIDSIWFESNN